MKEYRVRIEVDVKSTDFANITVLAHSKEDAKELAILEYHKEPVDLDFWESEGRECQISDNLSDWEVEEIK